MDIVKTSRGSSDKNLVATRRQDAVREVLSSIQWYDLCKK